MKNLNRRHFLKSVSAWGAALAMPLTSTTAQEESCGHWYRGNLHMHTQWSDGKLLPECAVAWYKDRGYNFICTSDHGTFQTDEFRFSGWCGSCEPPRDLSPFEGETSRWKRVVNSNNWAQLNQEHMDQCREKFGPDSVKTKTVEGQTFCRLTPFDELDQRFTEPGKFLLIPGFEQTGNCKDKYQVHMNFINVRSCFPYRAEENSKKTVDANFHYGQKFFKENREPFIFTLNHPISSFYDVDPRILIDNADIRFFEFNNNPLAYPKLAFGWTPDTYWDLINAYRVTAGQQLLLATGTDDEHTYTREEPRAWMVVRAKELTFPALFQAMNQGDFYTSNGLDFDDIAFDRNSGTLSVKVKPLDGRKVRIDFLGTRKEADLTITEVEVPAKDKQPARTIPTWSPEVGRVFQSSEGLEASYTLQSGDLYVRARVTTVDEVQQFQDKEPIIPQPGAWTQPWSLLVR
ncbi:MAG: hypothetical protein Q4G68_03915 [Planctomycetia bacterium]|nr:hypothetical protein [Planctomycetia bacterium]